MRNLARIFIALFCLVFLANQAQTLDDLETDHLGKTVGKLLVYAAKGIAYLNIATQANGKNIELVEARIKAIESYMEQNAEYVRPGFPGEVAEYVQSLRKLKGAKTGFDEANDDLFNFLQGK